MIFLALLSALVAVCSADNSYVILVPNVIRPGTVADVTVNIFKDDPLKPDVHVMADLLATRSNKVIATVSGIFRKHVPDILKLEVPLNLTAGQYHIRTRSTDIPINDSAAVTLQTKHLSIFVQTDKSKYKAGQTVKIRTFALHPNGTIYTGKFKIEIFDPKNNKIKQWLDLQEKEYGVISRSLPMDDKPVLGDWKIRITAEGDQYDKIFTVSEYVLPKFQVSLSLPPFALTSDREIVGRVSAKYTYGKPASGTVKVSVTLNTTYHPWSGPMYEQTLQIHGEAKFTIPLDKLQLLSTTYEPITESMDGRSLFVEASVNEELNNKTRSDSGKVTFRKQSLQMEFVSDSLYKYIPGLKYTAKIKFTEGNNRPPSRQLHPVNITIFGQFYLNNTTRHVEVRQILELQKDIPPSGVLEFKLALPLAKEIYIQAKYDDIERGTSLSPYTDRNTHVQLTIMSSNHQVGGNASFLIKATRPLDKIIYQVFSRGYTVKSGMLHMMNNDEYNFSLSITHEMTPQARCIVYYLDYTGEVYADMSEFSVAGTLQNKVSIGFDRSTVQPGEGVNLIVTADPVSLVNMLAVDQSVLIMGSGHDVSEAQVVGDLSSYNTGKKPSTYYNYYYNSLNPAKRFDEVGAIVLSDATRSRFVDHSPPAFPYLVPRRRQAPDCVPSGCTVSCSFKPAPGYLSTTAVPMPMPTAAIFGTPVPMMPGALNGMGTGMYPQMHEVVTQPPPLKTVDRVRTDFPESWLWLNKTTNGDGKVIVTTKVPDSITSWVASAFAINKVSGLGISPSHAKLEVFRPFFISLNLPFSVVRGEELVLQANVFNYMSEDLTVLVSLDKNDDFRNIVVEPTDIINYISETQSQTVVVKAGDAKSVYFPIIPSALGEIDISVRAQSTIAADGVKRKLRVKPEGVEKEYNVPMIIDLTNSTEFQASVPIVFPPSLVAGSEKVDITSIGNFMGSTVKGLDRLLRLPTGCGEQTMVGLAPDIFVLDYLQASGQLTETIKDKAISFMEKGYQRELTFQHRDGSFSAFGERDKSGSTWLTAFVAKSFHQAKRHIMVDDDTLQKALRWIINNQNPDGSFREVGSTHSTYLKGGAGKGVALTAFVALSLAENHDIPVTIGPSVSAAISKARGYLESQVSTLTDAYAQAIASYALLMIGSPMASQAFQQLDAIAIPKDGTLHWEVPNANTRYFWSPPHRQGDPLDIEATAYALLYHAHKNQYLEGMPVMKWILQQRNSYGGFASTQDTVLALEALTKFNVGGLPGSHSALVLDTRTNITGDNFTHKFTINDKNSMVLQSYKPTSIPTFVNISAEGSGRSLIQVSVQFNVENEIQDPAFHVSIYLQKETMSELTVRSCARYLKTGSSGMSVMELGLPTGFEADLESVVKIHTIKKVETDDSKVNFYFDEIDNNQVCVEVSLVRTDLVAKSQPIPVRVYDYYSPDNQATSFYESALLKSTTYCDVCPECRCPTSH